MAKDKPAFDGESSIEKTAKLDLAQYRTGDLVERLTELISVPKALRKVIATTLLFSSLCVFACFLISYFSELTRLPWLAICAYSLVAGFILGAILGILRIASTALLNVESILGIVLEITRAAATDYEKIQAGEVRMPSGGELVEQVYRDVVSPAIEQAIAGAFGFLGKPLLWTYHRTIGSAVRFMIGRVKRRQLTDQQEQRVSNQAEAGLSTIAAYSETIASYTSSASKIVEDIGNKIRFYAMLPMYVLFSVALLLATIPVLVVWYFATGDAE